MPWRTTTRIQILSVRLALKVCILKDYYILLTLSLLSEASAYPDFISSYTQISNVHDLSQHTDVDSSDEFSEIDDSKTKPFGEEEGLPQLASKIQEWSSSKERLYSTMDNDPLSLMRHNLSPAKAKEMDKEKFYFVQMRLLQNIETYASKLSQNVNDIMKFICDSSINVRSSIVFVKQT